MCDSDPLAKWSGGCVGSWRCPSCKVLCVCDSSGKAGTREGDVRYVWGPCCCGMSICPECGHDSFAKYRESLRDLFISPEAMDELKTWEESSDV
jgi:hypothetical protein